MFQPQFLQSFWRECQFGGVGLASQGYSPKHFAAFEFDIALEICQRAAHTHKIVDKNVFCTMGHVASKSGLPRQSGKPIRPGVEHDVGLINVGIHRPIQYLVEQICKDFWNGIDRATLKRMRTDQRWLMTCQQCQQVLIHHPVHRGAYQYDGCVSVSCLGRLVRRMLLHCRLTGVNQHIGEVAPRCARRLDQF